MSWVRLDDQFLTNPKVRRAGKDGRELYIAGLCYSAAQLTDGEIPADMIDVLAAQAQVKGAPTARTLVEVGLWLDKGECYVINGWAEYNESAEDVRRRREKDRLKKQAQRRNPKGQFEASPPVSPGDKNGDTPQDDQRDTPGDSPPSHPIPSTDVVTSSSETYENAPDGEDEDERIWTLVAERKLAEVLAGGGRVGNPERWKRTTADTSRAELAERLADLRARYVLTDTELADALLGRTNVLHTAQRRDPE